MKGYFAASRLYCLHTTSPFFRLAGLKDASIPAMRGGLFFSRSIEDFEIRDMERFRREYITPGALAGDNKE